MNTYIIGIDIGGTAIKLGIVDINGCIVWETKEQTPQGDLNLLVETICNMVEQARQHYHVLAVGIGCPGYADVEKGVISEAANLGLDEIPLKEKLEEKLNLTVRVDNDVQVAMMAEKKYGAFYNIDHAVYISLGTGIGGGYILDGKPYRGNKNKGGEIGHLITHKDGRLCTCGMKGCYEQYASVSALIKEMKMACESHGYLKKIKAIDGKQIFDALRDNEPVALNVYNSWLDEMCVGLISLMSIFAPERIVIGGGISNEGDFLERSISDHLHKQMPYIKYYNNIQVKTAQLGNKAGIIGAALTHREFLDRS